MKTETMLFKCKKFDDLTARELYEVLRLRSMVFVVEQNCVYLDADLKDLQAHQCMLWDGDVLVATSRLLPRGVSYERYPSIGRLCSHTDYRGKGAGKMTIELSLKEMEKLYPGEDIKISAQSYLIEYYKGFGFVSVGEEYLEDNIPHQAMMIYKGSSHDSHTR